MNESVYFDHSATTPLLPALQDNFMHYCKNFNANPSSIYNPAQKTQAALFNAKKKIALILGCETEEIIFTSGGSESINTAIKGIIFTQLHQTKIHIISSYAEHPATLNCLAWLKQKFQVELSYLSLDQYGQIDPNQLRKEIKPHTRLISLSYANSEIGTIQPINELAKIAKEKEVVFHCDAVQAATTLEININNLNVDLMSLSAHKFYGLKGVGILFRSKNIPMESLIHGGAQEQDLRAGTENTIGILLAADALEMTRNSQAQFDHVAKMTLQLKEQMDALDRVKLTGHPINRLSFHLSYIVSNVEANFLLMQLDLKNICASSGTACSTGNFEPSILLTQLGYTQDEALSSLRLTLGLTNTIEHIAYFIDEFKKICSR